MGVGDFYMNYKKAYKKMTKTSCVLIINVQKQCITSV